MNLILARVGSIRIILMETPLHLVSSLLLLYGLQKRNSLTVASFNPWIGPYLHVVNRLHSLLFVPFHKLLKFHAAVVSRRASLQASSRPRADHDPIKEGQELRSKHKLLKTITVVLVLELQDAKLVAVL